MTVGNFVALNGTKILERVTEINLRGVGCEVGGRRILTDFHRTFVRGKIYCFVGKNGAGKSTLMNLICGIIPLTRGEIFFDGIPLSEVDMIHTRRNLIAAFAKSADVLILDEPDNNLDAGAVDALTKQISAEAANRITIIISHDERLIELADEVLTLSV